MSVNIQSNYVKSLPNPLAAATTYVISTEDSGKILYLPVQTAIQTFTLPLPQMGLFYKIIVSSGATALGFAVTIASNPTGLFYGQLSNFSTSAITTTSVGLNTGSWPIVVAAKNASDSIIFTATAKSGDWVEMVSDGKYWYVNGMSTILNPSGATSAATLATAGLN
jgi:hypothetical protein